MSWRRHAEQLRHWVATPTQPQGAVSGRDEVEGPELISPDNNVLAATLNPTAGQQEESTTARHDRSARNPEQPERLAYDQLGTPTIY